MSSQQPATAQMLNQVVPLLVRVARGPGLVLLIIAALAVSWFAVFGYWLGTDSSTWVGWIPFAVAVVLALPVLTLAVLRQRLQHQTRDLGVRVVRSTGGVDSQEVAIIMPESSGRSDADEQALLDAAVAESQLLKARFMPRLEAAQRAARVAAGGTVNTPYLKDDLRITAVALFGTLAAIPLGVAGAFVTIILVAL